MVMSDGDAKVYNAAFVRIWSKEKAIGAGILVGDKPKPYILTCAHVVVEALGNSPQTFLEPELFEPPSDPIPDGSISIDFPEVNLGKNLEAKVEWWHKSENPLPDRGKDIAILTILNNQDYLSSDKIIPLKLEEARDLVNHSVSFRGFPDDASRSNLVINHPMPSEGKLGSQAVGLRDVLKEDGTAYPPQKGLSGAPVWDNQIHKVVGIFAAADKAKGISWMIPNEEISSSIPDKFNKFIRVSATVLDPIEIEPYDEFKQLINSIVNGNIVLFLGAGINPFIYLEFCSRLSNLVGKKLDLKLPNGQTWDSSRDEALKRQILVKQLIGIPCTTCPLVTKDRPEPCPIVDRIGIEKRIWTDPLYIEQELIIAKLNFRYLAQYFRLASPTLNDFYTNVRRPSRFMNRWPEVDDDYKSLTETFSGDFDLQQCRQQVEQQVKVHRFFAQLPNSMRKQGYPEGERLGLPYPVIITTKYDHWLEFALNNNQNDQKSFETIYYKISNDSSEIAGSFMHKDENGRQEQIDKEYSKLPVYKIGSSSDKLKPVICRLFGNWDDNFVITNEHFYNLLNDFVKLPLDLVNVIKDKSILFLGYSPTDYELQLIVDQLQKLNIVDKGNPSYLIHQLNSDNLGNLAEKIWEQRNVKLISIKGLLVNFVTKLQEEIEKKIQELKNS